MALTATGWIIQLGHVLRNDQREHDEALMACARAIDAGDELAIQTERIRLLLADRRIQEVRRMLAYTHEQVGSRA